MLDNSEENRNCSCTMQSNQYATVNYQVANMNSFNNNETTDNCNNCEKNEKIRREMMMKIRELDFAIIELALYLDTHPDDQKALCLHREYCKEVKPVKDQYQKVFGPLTIHYPCNKWRWLEEPWPWERGNF